MFEQEIQQRYGCVYVCQSSSTKFPVDSYLCVYVMKALLEVPKGSANRDVCVFVHARSMVGMGVCVVIFTLMHVCICILTPLIACDYIRELFYCVVGAALL